jgi:hypothetical protein
MALEASQQRVQGELRPRRGIHGGARRGILAAVVWIGVPAGWLLLAGLAGTYVEPDQVLLQIGIFVAVLVGLPWSVIGLSRRLLRGRPGAGGSAPVQARRPALRDLRGPVVPEAPRPAPVALGARRRAIALALLAAMFLVALAVWTAIPLGWLWIGSHLASSSEPGIGPYAIVIAGIVLSILAVVWLLYRCDAVYGRLTLRDVDRSGPSAWRKSLSDARQRRAWTTVDAVMTVSVIVAVLGMLVWFLLFADQHSMVEPYLS